MSSEPFKYKHATLGYLLVVALGLVSLSLEPRLDARQKPEVTLALEAASAERWSNDDALFKCKLIVDNRTGKELKVLSNFFSAFDGMVLVVQDKHGKELKRQPYVFHQSPMDVKKVYPLPPGKTEGTILFPVGELPKGETTFRVRLVGTLPGSGYEPSLSSDVKEVRVK